jgi:CelD/BcsL family acetyltransferase involved in cellulose biosynthesis
MPAIYLAAAADHERLACPNRPLETLEINDPIVLERYAPDWNALLESTPGASYFHTYEWFATYWRHFGDTQRMRTVLLFDGDRLTGVAPFVVARERTTAGAIRSLRYPLHGWGSFYGPIGSDTRTILRLSLKHLLATRRDWDVIDMLWVDHHGSDREATAQALADLHLSFRASQWLASAQIEISDGWESYWASRKSHFRTNVRRSEKRLNEHGSLEYIRHRTSRRENPEPDPRWDLYDACERIAASSWQGASTSGTTMSHGSIRNYLRAAHMAATTAGGVDMNLLLLNGRPIAFAYNYHSCGYVYGLRMGFESHECPGGAGTVLLRKMIEDSCHRGDRVIDLGPGSLDSKRHWHTRIAWAWRLTHYSPRSWRGQLLRILHGIKGWRTA